MQYSTLGARTLQGIGMEGVCFCMLRIFCFFFFSSSSTSFDRCHYSKVSSFFFFLNFCSALTWRVSASALLQRLTPIRISHHQSGRQRPAQFSPSLYFFLCCPVSLNSPPPPSRSSTRTRSAILKSLLF